MSDNTELYDLWLGDGFEEKLLDMARRGESKRAIAKQARAETEEFVGLDRMRGFMADLIRWGLDDINWHKIATDIEEQAKVEDEEEADAD